jgi:formylmethanofuran dehydrogenase subunit C
MLHKSNLACHDFGPSKAFARLQLTFAPLILLIASLFLAATSAAYAGVPIDWHNNWMGVGAADQQLPGIPTETVSAYQKELIAWGNQYNVPISSAISSAVVNKPVNPFGQQSPINYTSNIGGGATLSGKFMDPGKPLWRYMRDIVFLETTQNAIAHWKLNYYSRIGKGSDESAAYSRAEEIYKQYSNYLSGKDPDPNVIFPLLYNFIQFDYAGALTNESVLNIANGDAAAMIKALVTAGAGSDSNFTVTLDVPKLTETATNLLFKEIKNSFKTNSGPAQMFVDGAIAAGEGVVSGGSIVLLPGKVIGAILDSFGTWLQYKSAGSHLAIYYNLLTSHPECLQSGCTGLFYDDNGSLLLTSPYFRDGSDPILKEMNLRSANAQYDPEKIRAIYNMATLFWMIEAIDLEKAKASLTNYAYLDFMVGRSFQMTGSRTGISNQFHISLPSSVPYDAAKLTYPTNLSWSWAPSTGASGNPVSLGITSNPTTSPAFSPTNPNLTVGFDIDATAGKGGTLTATVSYANGFWKQSSIDLVFIPQHSQVSMSLPASGLSIAGSTASVAVDGDVPKSFLLNRRKTLETLVVAKDVTSQLTADGPAGTYSLAFDSNNFAGTGSFDFQIVVDGVKSAWATSIVKDANDTDGNGMADAWEIQYLGHIGVDPNADPDADGRPNLSEFLLGTDPTRTGAAEVTKIAHYAPYTMSDGTAINTFNPSGDLYANLYLEGGTLDLQGRTLVVHGNLIQSGGQLYVNGGKLIVNGDYRIQTATKAADGTVSYSPSYGYLQMTTATDLVVVNGQFVTQTTVGSYSGGLLTAGVLEVKGDFTQKNGGGNNGNVNFYASGTHKVLLSGSTVQTVNFENPHVNASHFNTLEITNNVVNGVMFPTPIAVTTLTSNAHKLTPITAHGMSLSLSADETIAGDLQITGSTLNLNGKTLTVEGNLIQSGGQLFVNGGKLIVNGDYRIQTATRAADGTVSYSPSYGYLQMTTATDLVVVNGQFVTQTTTGSYTGAILTAGVLEVKGDFTQKNGGGNNGNVNFYASGTHKVLLSGTAKQTVSFENPGTNLSHFNMLDWAGDSSRIHWATNYAVTVNKIPDPPTSVAAVAGNAQAIVSFLAPAQNGGSPITSYKVTATPGNSVQTGPSSPIIFTGLTNGTTYTFTATATNLAGTSVASHASVSVTPSAVTTIGYPLSLKQGWNLLGNSLDQVMPVGIVYGDPLIVVSVWKWDVVAMGWQFYSPQMDSESLHTYAAGKGYRVLSTIHPGDGYWVNIKLSSSFDTQTGPAFLLTANQITKGWNLMATGNNVSPSEFNSSLSAAPPATGVIPSNFTTLWAWDNAVSQWYFYAPSLEANGSLSNYLAGKGYLDFATNGKTLGKGIGFWVNRP